MQLRMLDIPVDGGDLRVLVWGTGRRVAVAVHGITASAMAWQAVARQMPLPGRWPRPICAAAVTARNCPGRTDWSGTRPT